MGAAHKASVIEPRYILLLIIGDGVIKVLQGTWKGTGMMHFLNLPPYFFLQNSMYCLCIVLFKPKLMTIQANPSFYPVNYASSRRCDDDDGET